MVKRSALSSATTRELILLAQSGDPDAGLAERQLIEVNEGLCRAVVRRLRPESAHIDEDLLQEARLAFATAIHAYDAGASASLATFAWQVMWRSLIKVAARDSRTVFAIPLGEEQCVEAQAVADRDRPMQFDEAHAIRDAVQRLPMSQSDRQLLWRLHWHQDPQIEVAKVLGISHTAVQKRHHRALTKLRSVLST